MQEVPWEAEEGSGCPGSVEAGGCELSFRNWGPTPYPLQEQSVFLPVETSFKTHLPIYTHRFLDLGINVLV